MTGPFDPSFEQLPKSIPIFPLSGALLLPHSRLPFNIFEPRYLNMTADALRGDRIIGMVQPLDPAEAGESVAVYPTGCAGRITQFSETKDGRYLITLAGLCRFRIVEELAMCNGYRRIVPGWRRFAADLAEETDAAIDRTRLVDRLRIYFSAQGIDADWQEIEETSDHRLVTTLAMICPFEPREKQALLDCRTVAERSETMIALMELAQATGEGTPSGIH